MVLTDASRHDWLEGRGPQLTLIGFQDDATSQILSAHFQLEAENTLGYFRAVHAMVSTHGVPLSVYRDRHGIFQRNDPHWTVAEQLAGKQCPTQLGRALEELGIQPIPAYSPQAKGRIERAWRTCQDRLVSELRLARACDLDSANQVLARFCADYNQRFAVPAREAQRDFRSLPPRFDLARCLSFRYQRVVGPDHVITFGAHSIALPACLPNAAMPGTPWISPITWMAGYSSLIGSGCFCLCLGRCRCRNFLPPARLRASSRRNQKTPCPASTTWAVAPP